MHLALAHLDRLPEARSRVIFTDECALNLEGRTGRTYVTRLPVYATESEMVIPAY